MFIMSMLTKLRITIDFTKSLHGKCNIAEAESDLGQFPLDSWVHVYNHYISSRWFIKLWIPSKHMYIC